MSASSFDAFMREVLIRGQLFPETKAIRLRADDKIRIAEALNAEPHPKLIADVKRAIAIHRVAESMVENNDHRWPARRNEDVKALSTAASELLKGLESLPQLVKARFNRPGDLDRYESVRNYAISIVEALDQVVKNLPPPSPDKLGDYPAYVFVAELAELWERACGRRASRVDNKGGFLDFVMLIAEIGELQLPRQRATSALRRLRREQAAAG